MTIVGHTHIGAVLHSSWTTLAFLTLSRQMDGHLIWLKTIASPFVTWRNRSRMGLLSVLPNARFIQTASTDWANLSSDRSMLFPKPNGRLRDSKWSIDVFGILVYRSGLQRRISPPGKMPVVLIPLVVSSLMPVCSKPSTFVEKGPFCPSVTLRRLSLDFVRALTADAFLTSRSYALTRWM
jgi:hypothetical protein